MEDDRRKPKHANTHKKVTGEVEDTMARESSGSELESVVGQEKESNVENNR